jgi:hypothetical protein
MEFITSSIYSEVGSYFSISHKVDLYIRRELNQIIKPLLKHNSRDRKMEYLNLIASTNKSIKAIEVKGPDYNQKEKFINWGLWLPYHQIVNQQDQREAYIKYYFDALVILLERYGVKEEVMRQVQKDV